jgi:DNA modification methylase
MNNYFCKIKDYIQPFERKLAIQELNAICGTDLVEDVNQSHFEVETTIKMKKLVDRLAYWETVSSKATSKTTVQSQREASINVVRNGIDLDILRESLPFLDQIPLPNRRCLRYGTHGIHEYRGKFFPQLVRSLINIAGAPRGAIIADPMSGSGTTIVEAALMGCQGIGLDMNPLSVFIGKTKCELLHSDPGKLKSSYLKVREIVLTPEDRRKSSLKYFNSLPEKDKDYLKSWFSDDVLIGLDDIVQAISAIKYQPAKNLMWVSLSNVLRTVSWQKDDDLRVRKEVRLDKEIDPKLEFLEELGRSVRAILAFIYQNGIAEDIKYNIVNGDARQFTSAYEGLENKVDVVITSPPYATALPYLDTDRLSLIYMGLLTRPDHRSHDHKMIGNREISEKLRKDYLSHLLANRSELPKSIHELIKKIENKNNNTDAGFRRRNLPALLAKYFFDMREVLSEVYKALKPGGTAYFVVGDNHTIAGGQRVDILTADLLEDIASMLNFQIHPSIPMEMLMSRDIFKKNASKCEKILVLKKPH